MPGPLRYHRSRVDRLSSCLAAALDELRAVPASGAGSCGLRDVLRQVEGELGPFVVRLDAIRASWFALAGSPSGPDVTILYDDARGDGRIVLAVGPLAAAERVAVLVPGMATTRANIGLQVTRARELLAECRRGAPELEFAVVVWLGYDAPDHLLEAASPVAAEEGGADLAVFVEDMALDGDRVTVIGNSYGSVVVGEALSNGLAVDAVVVTGTPGLGVRSRAEWGPAADDMQLYVQQAPGDLVGLLGAFGGVVPWSEGFGATRLAVNGEGRPRVQGHRSYFEPGSVAHQNIAAVVAGREEALVVQPAAGEGPLTRGFRRALDAMASVPGVEEVTTDLVGRVSVGAPFVSGEANLVTAGVRLVEGWSLDVWARLRHLGGAPDEPG